MRDTCIVDALQEVESWLRRRSGPRICLACIWQAAIDFIPTNDSILVDSYAHFGFEFRKARCVCIYAEPFALGKLPQNQPKVYEGRKNVKRAFSPCCSQ